MDLEKANKRIKYLEEDINKLYGQHDEYQMRFDDETDYLNERVAEQSELINEIGNIKFTKANELVEKEKKRKAKKTCCNYYAE